MGCSPVGGLDAWSGGRSRERGERRSRHDRYGNHRRPGVNEYREYCTWGEWRPPTWVQGVTGGLMNLRFVKNSMQQYKPEAQASVFPQAIRLTRLRVGLVFLSAQPTGHREYGGNPPYFRAVLRGREVSNGVGNVLVLKHSSCLRTAFRNCKHFARSLPLDQRLARENDSRRIPKVCVLINRKVVQRDFNRLFF